MGFLAFVRGLFFGALVGGVAGLLLAPQGGEELQAELRRRYEEVMEEGRRAAAERRAQLEAQLDEAKRVPRPA